MFLDSLGDFDLLGLHWLWLRRWFDRFLYHRCIRSFCDFGLFEFDSGLRPGLNDRLDNGFNSRLWRRCFDRDWFHHRRLFNRDFNLCNRMLRFSLFFLNRFRRWRFNRLRLAGDHGRFRFGNDHFNDGCFDFFGRFDGFRKLCFQSRFHGLGCRLFDRLFFDLLLAEGEHFLDETHCHEIWCP